MVQVKVVWPEDKSWYAGYADGKLYNLGVSAPTRGEMTAAAQAANPADYGYDVEFVVLAAGTPSAAGAPHDLASLPESLVLRRENPGF